MCCSRFPRAQRTTIRCSECSLIGRDVDQFCLATVQWNEEACTLNIVNGHGFWSTPNVKTVLDRYSFPGRMMVVGKLG
jgi:hypothetical protein